MLSPSASSDLLSVTLALSLGLGFPIPLVLYIWAVNNDFQLELWLVNHVVEEDFSSNPPPLLYKFRYFLQLYVQLTLWGDSLIGLR